MAPEVASVRPATTAMIVAIATAAIKPSMISPPAESFPPPRYLASSGNVRLPPRSAARRASWPTKCAAASPNILVQAKNAPARNMTQTTDRRAVLASGTV